MSVADAVGVGSHVRPAESETEKKSLSVEPCPLTRKNLQLEPTMDGLALVLVTPPLLVLVLLLFESTVGSGEGIVAPMAATNHPMIPPLVSPCGMIREVIFRRITLMV